MHRIIKTEATVLNKFAQTSFKAKLWPGCAGDSVDAVIETFLGKPSKEDPVRCPQSVGNGANHLFGATFVHLKCSARFHQRNGDEEKGSHCQIGEEHFLVLMETFQLQVENYYQVLWCLLFDC